MRAINEQNIPYLDHLASIFPSPVFSPIHSYLRLISRLIAFHSYLFFFPRNRNRRGKGWRIDRGKHSEKLDYRAMTSARGGTNRSHMPRTRRDPFSYPPFSHWFAIWRARAKPSFLPSLLTLSLSLARLNSIENFDCQHLFPRLSRNNLKRDFFSFFFSPLASYASTCTKIREQRSRRSLLSVDSSRNTTVPPSPRFSIEPEISTTKTLKKEVSLFFQIPSHNPSVSLLLPSPFFLFESIGRFSEGFRTFERRLS